MEILATNLKLVTIWMNRSLVNAKTHLPTIAKMDLVKPLLAKAEPSYQTVLLNAKSALKDVASVTMVKLVKVVPSDGNWKTIFFAERNPLTKCLMTSFHS